ncbi:putative signal transducing protein [Rhodobium gokarnense]|uniref:DUF2007 domain-containing protein n=1 Tax=Rhodobium gokarnense TaxID=364296 RepID=A0ABT3H787_9HYPH|nr:DUF2007 domain-containing protein [Rhodobium gokarnense]MCW2306258.1 hypothetical protein [Rhodobium gokarnense]
MEELLKTNDPVTLSFATSLLEEAGIGHLVVDQHMSIVEGSLGIIPRRLLVERDALTQARALCVDAGIGHELTPEQKGL